MSRSYLAKTSQSCSLLSLPLFGDVRPTSRRIYLRSTIWRLRRLLREAVGEGMDQELIAILNSLSENGPRIERAIVVWTDLIEALVQNTERRYGSKPGRGAIKSAEIKEVARYLLRADRFKLDIPNVPKVLESIVIDIVVSTTVDTIVLIANRYGLWDDVGEAPQSFQARLVIWWRRILALFQPLWILLARLISYIWNAFQVHTPLSPAVRSALEAVEREGMIVGEQDLFKGVFGTLAWVGMHRKQLVAAFELVFEAVQEAESFLVLSGPEKKAYARDLVFAVLDDAGFNMRGGLTFAIVSALVNGAIEAAVHIFTKRDAFPDRSSIRDRT